jgi:hypothetical protein
MGLAIRYLPTAKTRLDTTRSCGRSRKHACRITIASPITDGAWTKTGCRIDGTVSRTSCQTNLDPPTLYVVALPDSSKGSFSSTSQTGKK